MYREELNRMDEIDELEEDDEENEKEAEVEEEATEEASPQESPESPKRTPRPIPRNRVSLNSTFDLNSTKKRRRHQSDNRIGEEIEQDENAFNAAKKARKDCNETTDVKERFLKSMKQFRTAKIPWTEQEKEACKLFYNTHPGIAFAEVKAILKEMDCSLSNDSAMKIYHKIKTAWQNATKFKK